MIPEEKNAGLARALQEAFGVTEYEEIRSVGTSLGSNLVFRIVVKGCCYSLRIIMRVNEQTDPQRQFTCLQAAAEAGLTPRVWYASIEDGISITDFVEPAAFPLGDALVLIPATLRRLHALPSFPKEFNYVTAHKGFIWRFRETGPFPKDQIEEVFPRYEQLCAVYPRLDSDMVSCHMDLKPENILFDGQRVWLMNWQAAFVNDRYFDLAIVANFVIRSDADERKYLEEYFCQPPDEYQRARFFLMQQVLHMFSATVFLLLSSADTPVNLSEKLPSFRDLHQRIWAGDINFADNNAKLAYGRLHWEQLLRNMRHTRFKEALRIVSERHAGAERIRRLLPVPP
jgi:Phosphotransferase enzyme family